MPAKRRGRWRVRSRRERRTRGLLLSSLAVKPFYSWHRARPHIHTAMQRSSCSPRPWRAMTQNRNSRYLLVRAASANTVARPAGSRPRPSHARIGRPRTAVQKHTSAHVAPCINIPNRAVHVPVLATQLLSLLSCASSSRPLSLRLQPERRCTTDIPNGMTARNQAHTPSTRSQMYTQARTRTAPRGLPNLPRNSNASSTALPLSAPERLFLRADINGCLRLGRSMARNLK